MIYFWCDKNMINVGVIIITISIEHQVDTLNIVNKKCTTYQVTYLSLVDTRQLLITSLTHNKIVASNSTDIVLQCNLTEYFSLTNILSLYSYNYTV